MSLGKKLRKLRKEEALTQLELSKKLNIANSTLSLYEADKRFPEPDILERIADFFDVSIDFLVGRAGPTRSTRSNATPAEMVMLPILGDIRAGKPLFADEHLRGHMPFPKKMLTPGYDHFLLTIDGDSMTGDGIDHGDTALIRVQDFVEYDGQIAAVVINGCETCLKHVHHPKGADVVILRSSNSKYPDTVHPANDLIINGVYAGIFKAPKNGG